MLQHHIKENAHSKDCVTGDEELPAEAELWDKEVFPVAKSTASTDWMHPLNTHSYQYLQLFLSLSICCSPSPCPHFSPPLHFNGHFSRWTWVSWFHWSWGWWRQLELQDVQSSSQIIITNKPMLYRPDALPVTQPTVLKYWRLLFWLVLNWPLLPETTPG